MPNAFVTLPVPPGNGSGVGVDTSGMGALKTITVTSSGGVYEPITAIELSNDNGAHWSQIAAFSGPGVKTVEVASGQMRMTVSGFIDGVVPTASIGAAADTALLASLNVTPSNGSGAATDVSGLGGEKTVQVAGAYQGSVNIEVSEDGGITWGTAFTFGPGQTGVQTGTFAAQFMRVTRLGVPLISPGSPTVAVAATSLVEGAVFTDGITIIGNGTEVDPLIALGAAQTTMFFNVKAFGATGNGVTNDTVNVRKAFTAAQTAGGGTVWFPDGTYIVSETGTTFHCIDVPSSVTVLGQSREGSIVQLAGGQRASVRMFYTGGNDVAFQNLTIDGNKGGQIIVDAHRAGIFIDNGCTRITVTNVESRNNSGDGCQNNGAAFDVLFEFCYMHDNGRDGISVTGGNGSNLGTQRLTVRDCQLVGNAAQQFDTEANQPLGHISVINSYLSQGGNSTDFVLTISGTANNILSDGFYIAGNFLDGPVFGVWSKNVSFLNNYCQSSNSSPLQVHRQNNDWLIQGNFFIANNLPAANKVILCDGTSSGDQPTRIQIYNNTIVSNTVDAFGISLEGIVSAYVCNNTLMGAATSTQSIGINVRATISGQIPIDNVLIRGNYIADFVSGVLAQSVITPPVSHIHNIDISHNFFESINVTMTNAIRLNVGADNAVDNATCIGNDSSGVTNLINPYPPGPLLIGGNRNDRTAIFSCVGSPNTQITAAVGAMAMQRDGVPAGAASNILWIKTSGAGNTGWQTANVT